MKRNDLENLENSNQRENVFSSGNLSLLSESSNNDDLNDYEFAKSNSKSKKQKNEISEISKNDSDSLFKANQQSENNEVSIQDQRNMKSDTHLMNKNLEKNSEFENEKWINTNLSEGNFLFNVKNQRFMSSEEFNQSENKNNKILLENYFKNEFEKLFNNDSIKLFKVYQFENELRKNFMQILKKEVHKLFGEISLTSEKFSFEYNLNSICQEKEKQNSILKKIKNSSQLPPLFKDFEKKYEKNYFDMINLLYDYMEKSNKYKTILINFLMSLDEQVLKISKIRKAFVSEDIISMENYKLQKNHLDVMENMFETHKNEINNVSDSWVDRNSLLKKEIQNILTNEKEKMDSAKRIKNKGSTLRSLLNQYTKKKKSTNFSTNSNIQKNSTNQNSEKVKIANQKKKKSKISLKSLTKNSFQSYISEKNYQKDFGLSTSQFKYDNNKIFKKSLSKINSKLFTNKSKNSKSLIKTPRALNKNFMKKKLEFKDQIEEKLEFKPKSNNQLSSVRNKSEIFESIENSKIYTYFNQNKFDKTYQEKKDYLEKMEKSLKNLQKEFGFEKEHILIDSGIPFKSKDLVEKYKLLEHEINNVKKEIQNLENQKPSKSFNFESEDKLIEMNKVLKMKLKSLEENALKEKEIQRNLMMKNNLKTETNNKEIDNLFKNYMVLREKNEDLNQISEKRNSCTERIKESSRFLKVSLLSDNQRIKSISNFETRLVNHIENFFRNLQNLKNQIKSQESHIFKIRKEKESNKKEVKNLEKSIEKKKKNSLIDKNGSKTLRLQILKAQKNKSIEAKSKLIKDKEIYISKLNSISDTINENGKKIIEITNEQNTQLNLSKDLLKQNKQQIEDLEKHQKHLIKIIEKRDLKIENLKQILTKFHSENRFESDRKHQTSKSISGNRSNLNLDLKRNKFQFDQSSKKKNLSSNNLVETLKVNKKLYNNKNIKKNISTNFHNSKFFSETNSFPQKNRSCKQSIKLPNNSEKISSSKSKMRKVPLTNLKSKFGFKQRDRSSKSHLAKKLRSEIKNENQIDVEVFKKLKKEYEKLKKKYQDLESKYCETHSDLMRSKKSIEIENRRAKRKFEMNLKKNEKAVLGNIKEIIKAKLKQFVSFPNIDSISDYDVKEIYQSLVQKSSEVNLFVESMSKIDQRIYNLKKNIVKKFENQFLKIETLQQKILNIKNNFSLKNDSFIKSDLINLKEIELGSSLKIPNFEPNDKELKQIKEELNIEQKNNLNLREEINKLRSENFELKEKLKNENNLLEMSQIDDKSLIEMNKNLKLQIEELKLKKSDVEKQVKEIQSRYKMNYKKITELKKEIKDKDINYETLSENLANIQNNLKEKELEIEELNKIKDNENKVSNLDLQNDLMLENQENKRLHSIIDEKTIEIDNLTFEIQKLNSEKNILNQEIEEYKIKLNVISQIQIEKYPESKRFLDVMIDNKKVTEFATNGALKSFSFKNIITQEIKKGVFNTNTSGNSRVFNTNQSANSKTFNTNTSGNSRGINTNKSPTTSHEFGSKGLNLFHTNENINDEINQIICKKQEQERLSMSDNTGKDIENPEKDPKYTININNININHLNVSGNQQKKKVEDDDGPTLKNSQSQKYLEQTPNNMVRESQSLENNLICSKRQIEENKKIENFFDTNEEKDNIIILNQKKSLTEKSQKESKSKKSEIQKLYLDDLAFSEDSSVCSLSSKNAKKSVHGNSVYGVKPIHMKNMNYKNNTAEIKSEKDSIIKDFKDPLISPKSSVSNFGIKKKKSSNSSNSLERKNNNSDEQKLSKSTFSLKKTLEKVIENKAEEMSNPSNKKILNGNDHEEIIFDKTSNVYSDSEDEDLFGEKKIDSGVFSNKEIINVFEQDEVIEQIMRDKTVEVGETTLAYSQRIITQNMNTDNKKTETKGKQNDQKKDEDLLSIPEKKSANKNLFDQSFNNQSFAFQSNTSDFNTQQSEKQQNMKLLNTDQSFAAQDPLAFVSSSSFGMTNNTNIIGVLNDIKKDSDEKANITKNKNKKSTFSDNQNTKNLEVVQEEGEIKNDFSEIKINQIEKNEFDSTNSLNFLNELTTFKKTKNNDNMLEIMKDFNTGQMDQDLYDKIFIQKKKEEVGITSSKKESALKESENEKKQNRFCQDDSDSDFSSGDDLCFESKKFEKD